MARWAKKPKGQGVGPSDALFEVIFKALAAFALVAIGTIAGFGFAGLLPANFQEPFDTAASRFGIEVRPATTVEQVEPVPDDALVLAPAASTTPEAPKAP